ncbi:hypothetical protein LBYZC6_34630 [Lacrimispora brassicae]
MHKHTLKIPKSKIRDFLVSVYAIFLAGWGGTVTLDGNLKFTKIEHMFELY